jgi:hypothetical protein
MSNERAKSWSGRIAGVLGRYYLIFSAVLHLSHFGVSCLVHSRVPSRANL